MRWAASRRRQSGETLKALDAVASFVADWKAPKGPLVLGLKPAKTAGLDDLDKIMEPNALSTIFGFTATYPGTRAGAAKAGSKASKQARRQGGKNEARSLLAGATSLAAMLPLAVRCGPRKPIRRGRSPMIVPFPPGGVADITGRPTAHVMGKLLKQSVVVQNKGGAGGSVGTAQAARVGARRLHAADGAVVDLGAAGGRSPAGPHAGLRARTSSRRSP